MYFIKNILIILNRCVLYTSFFLVLFFFSYKTCFSQQSSPVKVDKVIKSELNQSIPLIGSIKSMKEADISSAVGGVINKIFIVEGDRVKKGQTIAIIDKEKYEWLFNISNSEVLVSESELKTVQLEIIMNNIEINRIESLKGSSVFNLAKYQNLQNYEKSLLSKEKIAESKLNITRNQEYLAKLNLDRSRVRAAFSGVIEKKYVETGEIVNIGSPIVRLISDTFLEIHSEIPSNRARVLVPNYDIKVETSDGISFISQIRAIGVREDSSTRSIPVYLKFNTQLISRKLNIGENLTVFIPVGPGIKALTVHKDAILKREGMSFVYVVVDDIVQIRPVKLGDGIGDRFRVLQGLKVDDLTVVKGNERLRPDQKVKILP